VSSNIPCDIRALSKLIFGGDRYFDRKTVEFIPPEPAILEVGMLEADFSNRNLGAGGAIIIAAWITHKNRGGLSVTNVMGNHIGKEQLSKLQEIMRSKPNLVSLCGIADGATEADLSGLGMDADDAIVLASELPDKGAMTSLNLANNSICYGNMEGIKAISSAVKVLAVILVPF
jgi:hypothetical protein